MVKQCFLFVFFLLFAVHCSLAQSDTVKTHLLNEVEIQALSAPSSYKAGSLMQILRTDNPEKLNALSVADAVKHFSGVQVIDYGGVGGLKTISLRGFGASHTQVAYDGISVSDYQSGQTDLGRFSLDNVEMLQLYIGENDDIFQSAQSQSLAGILHITTASPLSGNKKEDLKANLKTGSFGLINPFASFAKVLSSVWSINISADYLKTEGNYPFIQTIGYDNQLKDSLKRKNSDVEILKLETGVNGQFKNGGRFKYQNYYYVSQRGLPSAVHYYNNDASERLFDRNFFTQMHYSQPVSKKIDFQANGKFDFSFIDYANIKNIYENGKRQTLYYQREYYANAGFLYKYSDRLSFSWANDGIYSNFNTTQTHFAAPQRIFWFSALSGKYETPVFNATAKLLNTSVEDKEKQTNATIRHHRLSPYIGFSVMPFRKIPVRIRFFYKNTFRMPTFGDIYYSPVINVNLKPENARQYNLGLTLIADLGERFTYIAFSGDTYRNYIRNKIVAVPVGSTFNVSVRNYGKVFAQGFDLNLKMHISTGPLFKWKIDGTYSFQQVLDRTDPYTLLYNQQVMYTPRHLASGQMEMEMPWINLNYSLRYCGKRYYERINYPEYQLDAFSEHGISAIKTIRLKNVRLTATAECLNLFNTQYEVIVNYPMQGRSFRFGIKLNY